MVGIETALADDPALTVRLPGLDRKPLRVVLDTHLRLPLRSRLVDERARHADARRRRAGRAARGRGAARATLGVEVERVGADGRGHVDLGAALRRSRRPRRHARLQRGRPALAARLIALGLADEVVLITAEKPLGVPASRRSARRRGRRSPIRRAGAPSRGGLRAGPCGALSGWR